MKKSEQYILRDQNEEFSRESTFFSTSTFAKNIQSRNIENMNQIYDNDDDIDDDIHEDAFDDNDIDDDYEDEDFDTPNSSFQDLHDNNIHKRTSKLIYSIK